MDLIEQVRNWGRALTVAELAELMQISERSIQRYIAKKKLPAIRIGGLLRLNPESTANWLAARQS
ncbi:MAG: helix-turn-helix domain-containing protein [Terracidiphilus sp.]